MVPLTRTLVVMATSAALVLGPIVPSQADPVSGPAPGAPGVDEQFLPADKSGFGTATAPGSKVWLTVQKEGGLGELFYPDLVPRRPVRSSSSSPMGTVRRCVRARASRCRSGPS